MKFIGEFYREKVLSLPKKERVKRTLPTSSDTAEIVNELLGWRLYVGKEVVECRSEDEARYLKVFLESHITELYAPKDDAYLKSILPELETLKTKTDRVIDSYLETVLDRRIRERLKYEVYMEVTK